MQLKRLEAYGFKSFADKIEIEFDHGVTAIVGPNGSGKSNITDAIRWVLGEQNVRNLRGTKSEDIIFTGSSSRKPLGIAEVTLTLLNDGDLSLPFDEITVTRRLFRSGESEFFINKGKCRLKDIYALFADTGLGHDGISVISQNKMDDILNSRPEERRLFFEETAGITKFRDRKNESVKKLDDTEKNLTRVNDIIGEIEVQLEPLAVEAERTEKYNNWNSEYTKGRITEIYRKIQKIHEIEQTQTEVKEEKEKAKILLETDLRKVEVAKEELENNVLSLDTQIQNKNQEKNQTAIRLENIKSSILLAEQKAQQENQEYTNLQDSIKNLEHELTEEKEAQEKLSAIEKDISEKFEKIKVQFDAEQKKSADFAERIRSAKSEIQVKQSEKENIKQQLAEKQNDAVILEKDIESGAAAHESNVKEFERLESVLRDEKLKCKEQEESLENVRQSLVQLKNDKDGSLNKQKKAAENLKTVQQQLRIDEQYVAQGSAKLNVLEHMQQAYEGFGRSVKAVLLARESWRPQIYGAVAELIHVDAKYLSAVEAALGAAQQNLIVKDAETAKKAIDFLKRTKAGRVTFLPLSDLAVRSHPDDSVKNMHGVIGYLDEVITTDEPYKKAVSFLLAKTLLVDNFDHAIKVARNRGFKFRIVTLDGEILNPGGSLSGGSIPQKESGFLNRSNELIKLREDLKARNRALAENEDNKKRLLAELQNFDEEIQNIKDRLESKRIHEAELKVAVRQIKENIEQEEKTFNELRILVSSYDDDFSNVQKKRIELKHEIDAIKETLKNYEAAVQNKTEELDDLEQDASDFSKWLHQLELQKVGTEHEVLRSHEHVLLSQKKISGIISAKDEAGKKLSSLQEELTQGKNDVSQLIEEKEGIQREYSELDAVLNTYFEQKMNLLTKGKEQEETLQEIRKKMQKVQDELHSWEIEHSKRQFNLEQYEITLRDEYHFSVAEAAEQLLDIDDESLGKMLKKLKADILALGTVNLQAIDDYKKQKERYDFLKLQADDLSDAKENLMKIIAEIDATMTKQFKAAFLQIQQHFNDIFVALFGGGHAELSLTNEKEILQSGVEINVQLPQKKQQNLSVLSGGERALTVIALLFAFLKVRPAPFSVLDEIDAPLDEANIMRFGKFLRDFSEQTQFVVVTHRKGTMESADMMYGVTLEDAGVSKILSVKLDDIAG